MRKNYRQNLNAENASNIEQKNTHDAYLYIFGNIRTRWNILPFVKTAVIMVYAICNVGYKIVFIM